MILCIPWDKVLTHWGRVTLICVGKLTIIVSIMACRLVGAKPLSEPMLAYHWFEHEEQTSVKSSAKITLFYWRKYVSKCCLRNVVHFFSASMCWWSYCYGQNPSHPHTLTVLTKMSVAIWYSCWRCGFVVVILSLLGKKYATATL